MTQLGTYVPNKLQCQDIFIFKFNQSVSKWYIYTAEEKLALFLIIYKPLKIQCVLIIKICVSSVEFAIIAYKL